MALTPTNGQKALDSDEEFYSPPGPGSLAPNDPITSGTPLKRKHATEERAHTAGKRQKTQSPVERLRLPLVANLPCELWQRIFSLLPPRSLPPMLWTCRTFYKYLTDPALQNSTCTTPRGLCTIHPDQIWQASRTAWLPDIPSTPPGISEPDLFKLLGRKSCQLCGRLPTSSPGASTWMPGPGNDGVRRVWSFTVRSCGPCLTQHTQDDRSLMLSEFSGLLPVASFIFLTQDQHVLSPSAFRLAGEIPQSVDVRKAFFLPQLRLLKERVSSAKEKSSREALSLLSALSNEQSALFEQHEAWETWASEKKIERFRSQVSVDEVTTEVGNGLSTPSGMLNLSFVNSESFGPLAGWLHVCRVHTATDISQMISLITASSRLLRQVFTYRNDLQLGQRLGPKRLKLTAVLRLSGDVQN